jgi:hypothetical protein
MLSQSLITIESLPPLAALGATSDELAAMGKALAAESHSFSFSSSTLETALGALSVADRQSVVIAYTTAGGDAGALQLALSRLDASSPRATTNMAIAWGVLSTLSCAASVFHGYRRNDSVGWGIWWGFMGALFPVITPTIAVAQGFGKPKR